MPVSGRPPTASKLLIHARLGILTAMFAMTGGLLALGYPPALAVIVTVLGAAGAAEVGCRLTMPLLWHRLRATVVVVILVFVFHLLSEGANPWVTLVVVLATAFGAIEVSRKLTGVPYRLPRLTF